MAEKDRKIDIEKRLKVKASMISGMVSGAIYKSILHPIDTIKVKILVITFGFGTRFSGV